MRPLVIELVHEGIEAGLLLEDIRGRRPRGLGLQRQVQALVPPILLGMSRRNALQADAEAEPPDGELAQPVQRMRGGEGHAIVRADGLGKPILLKRALEDGERVAFLGGREASQASR